MQNPIFVKENKEENSMKKYYDVYFEVHDDSDCSARVDPAGSQSVSGIT